MESLYIVVLPSAECSGGRLRSSRWLCCRTPIRGRWLAGVCEAVAKGCQVLSITILAIREFGLPSGSLAQVLSWCGGRCKTEGGCSRSGGRGRNLWSVLVCLGCAESVTKLRCRAVALLMVALRCSEAARRGRDQECVERRRRLRRRPSARRQRGSVAAYGLARSRHPHSLWPIRLLPALGRLCCPTISCAQDAPGHPLARTELSRGFAVARLRLLYFHFFCP